MNTSSLVFDHELLYKLFWTRSISLIKISKLWHYFICHELAIKVTNTVGLLYPFEDYKLS